jgi:hypothetical protein
MNSPSNLYQRLLKLYPVKILKEHFDPEATTQVEIIPEIIANSNADAIKQFSMDHHNYSKQHVYFFRLGHSFDRFGFNFNGLPFNLEQEILIDGSYVFKFLPIINYNVVLGDPIEEQILKFYQPVTLIVNGNTLMIQMTIMEKNIDYYYGGRKVYESNKEGGEDYLLKIIKEHFETFFVLETLDLNKGIKKLWEDDIVDSKYAKWKKSHSTTTEQMDEEYTLKQKYPDLYKELIKSPLNRTIFKNITENEDICSHFSMDPTKGFLTISIYPDNLDQTKNVINKILTNN